MPTEQEILAYAKADFYEETEYTEELYRFLIQHLKLSLLAANGFIAELLWFIRIEEPMSAQCGLFEPYVIVPKDLREANQLIEKIQNVNNNTRKWANCGYTPKELFEEYQKNNT